jgi:hypothetical protein
MCAVLFYVAGNNFQNAIIVVGIRAKKGWWERLICK